MIFEYSGTIVTLDDPAQYPQQENTELIQAKERSASGIIQTEDFSVRIGTFTYNFVNMSRSDYTALVEFFLNTVTGILYAFLLTDDLGVQRTVRFTSSQLSFTNTSHDFWNGNFTVEEIL